MNKNLAVFFFSFLLLFATCSNKHDRDEMIYQYSTLTSLIDGNYEGELRISDLKNFGDFGLGTFNGLDGEMVISDGVIYQIDYFGNAKKSKKNINTPFAVVTNFTPDIKLKSIEDQTCDELKRFIGNQLPDKNLIYAIKIEGSFKNIETRSVEKQEKPYRGLYDVLEDEELLKLSNIKGELIGFWFPYHYKKLNVPDFHFHFITRNKKKGGHLLNCTVKNVKVEIDYKNELQLSLK